MAFFGNTVLRRNSSAPPLSNSFAPPLNNPPFSFNTPPSNKEGFCRRLFCSGVGFKGGVKKENLSVEEKKMRNEILDLESNLEALRTRIINKRKEEKALNIENMKKTAKNLKKLQEKTNKQQQEAIKELEN